MEKYLNKGRSFMGRYVTEKTDKKSEYRGKASRRGKYQVVPKPL